VSDPRIPTAILGAGGYVGQHFARLLSDHPWFAPTVLVAGDRSGGRSLEEVWHLAEPPPAELAGRRLERRSPAALARSGIRVAFSALPSGTAGPLESELVRRGVSVFTNAADHRMDARVPLLVPEVNARHLALVGHPPKGRGILVANPNCSAAGLVLGLAPLVPLLVPRAVHVTTYQALSGAGYPGVSGLSITDNVVPYIAHEEEKIAGEAARILGRGRSGRVVPWGVPILAHCARVATREGHLEAVTIEATRRPELASIRAAWTEYDPLASRALPTAPHPPIVLRSESDRPQPLRDRWAGHPARARGMAVTIGRVRWDSPYLRFFLLSHNAVRGAAGASILNAERAAADGILPGVAEVGA
jgi:aspartate-semialdehyde dehydrogenase